jgi:hypothetical protein
LKIFFYAFALISIIFFNSLHASKNEEEEDLALSFPPFSNETTIHILEFMDQKSLLTMGQVSSGLRGCCQHVWEKRMLNLNARNLKFADIASSKMFSHLNFSGSAFDSQEFSNFIKRSTHIKSLDLSDLDFASIGSLDSLLPLNNLRFLSLRNSDFRDYDPSALASLTTLEELNLDSTGLNEGVKHLSPLTNLRVLNIAYNQIYAADVQALTSLINLERLDISKNKIEDVGFKLLFACPELMHLDLSATSITCNVLNYLNVFPYLQHLNIENNRLNVKQIEDIVREKNEKKIDVVYSKQN